MTTTNLATSAFVVERDIRIEAPRERVFPLVSSLEGMQRWFRPTVLEPERGGRIEITFPFDDGMSVRHGEITAYDPPSRVAFTWTFQSDGVDVITEVAIDLIAEGDGTRVRLTHTGFLDEGTAADHHDGWGYWLARLQVAGDGGDPGPDKFAPPPAAA